ncbi:MAG: arylsulfatase [Terracidiphilus sp.]|nr:arylsulfatase [Terracidiphilus sp.]
MDRRSFLSSAAAVLAASGVRAEARAVAAENVRPDPRRLTKPNVLLLMADQLRFDCVGAYGNKAIHTPNLDRLAREGVRFATAYSTTPSCTPARSSLLTGMGPWRHGLLGYGPMASRPYAVEKARVLAEAGYFTISVGKNHYNPIRNAHGYHQLVCDEHCDYWFDKREKTPVAARGEASWQERSDYEAWFWSQAPDKNPHATGLGWNDRRGKPFVYPEQMHATHWTAQTAVNFLKGYEREEPFFLKVSFIRPHCPYDAPERFFKLYEGAQLPEAQVGAWASRNEPMGGSGFDHWRGKIAPDEIRKSRLGYYAGVSYVDEQIGRVMNTLEQRGLLEETLILFVSDHGDMLGDQNLWRKTYAYEGSARIPMMMRIPKHMGIDAAGTVIDNPVELRDVLPTLLDAAGAEVPETMDGKSLLELVRARGKGWREWIDLEHDLCYAPENHWNALTDGKWKYIYHARKGEEQLFDLVRDPQELHDLTADAQHSAELEKWRTRLAEHLAERGADWVRDGKLQQRQKSQLHSPNFPGFLTAEESLKKIDYGA